MNPLYSEAILEHSRQPRNFRVLAVADFAGEGRNPVCGDRVTVFLRLEEDRIADLSFQGNACAIAKASASMMTEKLAGKTLAEAKSLFCTFQKAVATGKICDDLGPVSVLAAVSAIPTRRPCALLPWEAIKPVLYSTLLKNF